MGNILRVMIEMSLYFISGFTIRKKNRIIFGTWNGEKYTDNSKHIFKYLAKEKEYELIWCGQAKLKEQVYKGENIKFVEYGSIKASYYALTSKYAFITHSQNDISKYNLLRNAKVVQLWHGIGIKSLGISNSKTKKAKEITRLKVQSILRKYDYFICSSKANKERNLKAFKPYGITSQNVINSGQPRNDIFFHYEDKDIKIIRRNYFKKYGISKNKKIITYMPTFRKDKDDQFLFANLDKDYMNKLENLLEKHNAILLEKVHYQDKDIKSKNKIECKYLHRIGSYEDMDTQELLLITDMLITDYSSCYMDYVLLDRPIIHFAYDYQKYINSDQGLYYDLYRVAAGDVIYERKDLFEAMDYNLTNTNHNSDRRAYVYNTMMEYETGESCKIISRKVLKV